MKREVVIVLYLCVISIFSTCKKQEATVIMVDNGSWKVNYFSEDGNDETSAFVSYSFRFEKDGTVKATSPGGTLNGSWSAGYDDDRLKFNISFASSPLNKLNEDWDVLKEEGKMVQLRHISGGTDFLTFKKQ